MTKHDIAPLPPYPRLGECYRLLAKALGTKSSNRHIDQLAREGDFDWQLLTQLRAELIEKPLRTKSNQAFSQFIVAAADTLQDGYVGLIKAVQLDALTREQSLPVLITHLFAPFAASFLLQLQKAVVSPPMAILLDEQNHPIEVVFDWLEGELSVEPHQLTKQLYPDASGENKNGRELMQRWRDNQQLPDLQSIYLLRLRLENLFPKKAPLVQAFTEWLIVARALVVLSEAAAPYLCLRNIILREVLSNVQPEDIGVILSTLNIRAAAHKRDLVEGGLLLFEKLKRTTEKSLGDQARTRYALDQFRHLLSHHDPEGISTYYLEWLEGRWHVLAGQLDEAVPHFERAANLALYRSGQTQKDILRESLLLAAYQGDRPLYKRLKHRALVMDLSYLPGWDESVATAHELKMIRDNFMVKFPERGRFVDPAPEFSTLH